MIEFREIYIAELKAVGFSASDAEEVAAWYLGTPGTTPFPAHCRRVPLAAPGYDPSQPRNADGEWTAGGGGARLREPETKPQHDRYGLNDAARLAAEPGRNAERARTALDEVMRKRSGYVDNAAYRAETGWIRLDWGDAGNPHDDYKGGHGIAHILAKHPADLKYLPEVIAKGKAFKHPTDGTKTYFVHEGRFAVVASLHKGAKKTITEYAPDRPKEIAAIMKYPPAVKPGENKGG